RHRGKNPSMPISWERSHLACWALYRNLVRTAATKKQNNSQVWRPAFRLPWVRTGQSLNSEPHRRDAEVVPGSARFQRAYGFAIITRGRKMQDACAPSDVIALRLFGRGYAGVPNLRC